jgi:hypothetical protein
MEAPKFPFMARALEAYGPNPRAQAQKIGVPYTTLRDWLIYGRTPSVRKLAPFPDLLGALTADLAAQAEGQPEPETHHEPG